MIYRYVIWLLVNLNARDSSDSHAQEAEPRNSAIRFARIQRGDQGSRPGNDSIGISTLLRDLRTTSLGRLSGTDVNVNEHRTNGNPITEESNTEVIGETNFYEEENHVKVSCLLAGLSLLIRSFRVERRQSLFVFENLFPIRFF